MSAAGPLIRLQEVSLRYRLARQRIPSFKEYAIHWVRRSLDYDELWALREVSLTIGPGERVGIVGRNGAGKSTLLKVIAGVLVPTRGQVTVQGSVAPLLELGTGFDDELTGMENIYLNALLLGRRRREIEERVEEIADYSELGDFLRSPLRNYSTGMVARLGFAIATAWKPDILILDEVLSAGDAAFQAKCKARMASYREGETIVLLVSHSPDSILESCDRCLWIDKGELRLDGPAEEVLDAYAANV